MPENPPPDEPPPTNEPSTGKGPTCHHCGAANLFDTEAPPGIRCEDCGKLVWFDDGQSLSRVRWHDHDLGGMAPQELPPCPACGAPCDTQTSDDVWRCSRCLTAANLQDD
ncbi:hypothetical protein [Rubripirellula obstinata]|uniref:hypothetical protein n=1 Tax=Rubripirellula obstinata TaxID=406547 RepID=UPI00082E46DF|nr:hypothetical protein [Rubripirellula obstinata]